MTVDRDPVRRLVVRAPNWLGDAVMAMPALASVRQAFATAHVTVAAIPSIAPVFQEETSARQDDLLVIPDRRREIELLAGGQFDAILLLTNSFRTALACAARRHRRALGLRARRSPAAADARDRAPAAPPASVALLPCADARPRLRSARALPARRRAARRRRRGPRRSCASSASPRTRRSSASRRARRTATRNAGRPGGLRR